MQLYADQIRPLRDQLVVEVLAESLVRPSGIVIPDNVAHSSCQGRVIATDERYQTAVLPGDHILFGEWQEHAFTDPDGKEWLLVSTGDVLGRYEDEYKPEHERLLSII